MADPANSFNVRKMLAGELFQFDANNGALLENTQKLTTEYNVGSGRQTEGRDPSRTARVTWQAVHDDTHDRLRLRVEHVRGRKLLREHGPDRVGRCTGDDRR